MGKILEAFLTEQLRVDSGTEQRSAEHQQLCEKGNELQDKLAEKLNDEEKGMLSELMETLFQESCYGEQRKLEHGFRLGVLMASEIFTEQDIFLWEEERNEHFRTPVHRKPMPH